MNNMTKQNEVSQIKMTQENSNYWLHLLGDRNHTNGSAGFGHNSHSIEMQALATYPEMLDYKPEFWLRHLSGTSHPNHNHATNNGRVAKMAPEALGNQRFTPEIWLRLLGTAG